MQHCKLCVSICQTLPTPSFGLCTQLWQQNPTNKASNWLSVIMKLQLQPCQTNTEIWAENMLQLWAVFVARELRLWGEWPCRHMEGKAVYCGNASFFFTLPSVSHCNQMLAKLINMLSYFRNKKHSIHLLRWKKPPSVQKAWVDASVILTALQN